MKDKGFERAIMPFQIRCHHCNIEAMASWVLVVWTTNVKRLHVSDEDSYQLVNPKFSMILPLDRRTLVDADARILVSFFLFVQCTNMEASFLEMHHA